MMYYPPQTPKDMTVGPKVPRSSNMPEYLPTLPDSHTFINTPVRPSDRKFRISYIHTGTHTQ